MMKCWDGQKVFEPGVFYNNRTNFLIKNMLDDLQEILDLTNDPDVTKTDADLQAVKDLLLQVSNNSSLIQGIISMELYQRNDRKKDVTITADREGVTVHVDAH